MCMSSFFFLLPELDWDHEQSRSMEGGRGGISAWAGACRVNSINFLAASTPLALPLLVTQMKIYCICFMHALTQYKQDTVLRGWEEGTVRQTDNRDI